jgi:hypothetical protein
MVKIPVDDAMALVSTFQGAWLTLLDEEYIQSNNIDRVPGLLMSAVLDTAENHADQPDRWLEVALKRLKEFESALSEAMTQNSH